MKKTVKILSIIILTIIVLSVISNIVFADSVINPKDLKNGEVSGVTEDITNLGQKVVSIIQTVGVVVAVIILLVLGIKYMIGSPEDKSEYKKSMIPYIVGAILIFASTTIVNIIYNLANGLNA